MSQRFANVGARLRNPIIIDDNDSDRSEDHQSTHTPITSRIPSDETDTDSVATDSTEDTVTDNGEEHPTSYRARLLRKMQAKYRVNNTIDRLDETLQYANDGVIDGFQAVYRGVMAATGFLYNDIAGPVYREVSVQLHVGVLMVFLAFAYGIACVFDLLILFFGSHFRSIHWLWWAGVDSIEGLKRTTLDFFDELWECLDIFAQWLWLWGHDSVMRLGAASLNFIIGLYDCLAILIHWLWQVGVDSVVYLGRISIVGIRAVYGYLGIFARMACDCLDMFLHWLVHDGMRLAILLVIPSMITISIVKGWLGMSLYVCDNTVYNNNAYNNTEHSFLQSTCELDGVNNTIQIVNSELAALLDASDTVILTTDDMKNPIYIDLYRSTWDLIETMTDVKGFAKLHELTDPTISPEDTGALATILPAKTPSVFAEIHKHAWEIRNNSEIVRHELEIRYDELNVRLNGIQKYSKKSEPQSAAGLLFSETSYYLLPSAFKLTHAHRQASDYARVARQILEDSLTASILEKTSIIVRRIEEIAVLMVTVRDTLRNFQDDWTVACAPWKAIWGDATVADVVEASKHLTSGLWERIDDACRCAKDPETYIKELDAAIFRIASAAKIMGRVDAEHYAVLQGLVAVHTQVLDLLDNAGGYKGEPRTKPLLPELLEPRSSDGHSHCVGQGRRHPINITPMTARTILRAFVIHVGEMNIKLGRQRRSTEDEFPVGKNRYHWYMKDGKEFWDDADYTGKPPPQRWSNWVGEMVDTCM